MLREDDEGYFRINITADSLRQENASIKNTKTDTKAVVSLY